MNDTASNRTAAALLAELDMLRGRPCADCARPICGHEAVCSVALGFKNAARCLTCLAAALNDAPRTLRDHVLQHIRRRDCYRHGWLAASEREGFGAAMHPRCLWSAETADGQPGPGSSVAIPAFADRPAADAEWDAGDMGCGELVLELRLRLTAMAPGSVLKLTARDPGAREDLPAWCGMTGHRLLKAQPPEYWIERRKEN